MEFLVLQFQCSLGRTQVNHFCPANSQHCPHAGKASRYVSETAGMDFSFLSRYGFQFSVGAGPSQQCLYRKVKETKPHYERNKTYLKVLSREVAWFV